MLTPAGKGRLGSWGWRRLAVARGGISLLFVTILAMTGLHAQAKPNPPASGPRLEVEAKEVDLGTLDRGQKATARFSIRNDGDQPARILNVKPG